MCFVWISEQTTIISLYSSGIQPRVRVPPGVREYILGGT
jgi:hypothetical protein